MKLARHARVLSLLILACLLLAACQRKRPRKPDPARGSVTGTVLCSDTGKPARFATITLVALPRPGQTESDPDSIEQGTTGLDGEFDLEAIRPGDYYAYATLDGYLAPETSVDFERAKAAGEEHAQLLDTIAQWQAHLVQVHVHAQRASTVSIVIDRAATIRGAVTYDDGSPAIGMHFRLLRKGSKDEWHSVGLRLFSNWAINAVTDDHGQYSLTGLPAGDYIVCTLLPVGDEATATPVCSGNTTRPGKATPVKLSAGEVLTGQDIVIPVAALHTVSGNVSVAADGHPPTQATVHLLYADDRKEARATNIDSDGAFEFEFVPEENYILRVTGAADQPDTAPAGNGADEASGATPAQQTLAPSILYADKELPIQVQGDLTALSIQLLPKASAPNPH